jgi:hypothetical protein
MSAVHFSHRARLLSVAAFVAAVFSMGLVPAVADQTAVAARLHEPVKRTAAALKAMPSVPEPRSHPASFLNGFVYATGPQSIGFRGRVNVGKSGVYLPYYGNVDTDPLHPNVESVTGIAYGFRTFDLSLQNSAGLTPGVPAPNIPGGQPPKANPSLTFSIRF